MRSLARLSPALLGLVLAVPATGRAQTPGTVTSSAVPQKHQRGLFRSCMCPDCQRARVKARDGVDVPAPPPVPANIVSVGDDRSMPVDMSRRGLFGGNNQECAACQEGTIVGAPAMVAGRETPGRAVVDEPTPIGRVQGPASNQNKTANAGRRGKKDASVATAQYASPSVIGGPGHNPPHIIQHLFGLDAIGKREAEAWERRQREKHASIAYGPQKAQAITELPASMVYKGR